RISRARVLTRRAAAIETLGSATVLCTDKTGTLTENRMSIAELCPCSDGRLSRHKVLGDPLPDDAQALAFYGVLASAPVPFDPMEKAFHDLVQRPVMAAALPSRTGWTLARSYGLRPDLLAVTQAWHPDAGQSEFIIASKGAPEAVVDLCRLDAAERAAVQRTVDAMAAEGLRVLGVAKASHDSDAFPVTPRDFAFTFLGLVGLADPLRASVPQAVRDCRSAGIRVVMITGDYPVTARAIAQRAGLDDGTAVMSGEEMEGFAEGELRKRVLTTTIFARIM